MHKWDYWWSVLNELKLFKAKKVCMHFCQLCRMHAEPGLIFYKTHFWASFSMLSCLSCLIESYQVPQNTMSESPRYDEGVVQFRVGNGQRCSTHHVPTLGSVMTRTWQQNIRFSKELLYWAARHSAPEVAFGPWCLPHLTGSEPVWWSQWIITKQHENQTTLLWCRSFTKGTSWQQLDMTSTYAGCSPCWHLRKQASRLDCTKDSELWYWTMSNTPFWSKTTNCQTH